MISQHTEEPPKNIVIWLRDNLGLSHFWKFFIDQEDEDGVVHQIVLRQEFNPTYQPETFAKRIGRRVGIQQQSGLPTYATAAAKAYKYIKENYNVGDKVVLLGDSDVSPDAVIAAAELLVKCLSGNKAPPNKVEDLARFDPGDAGTNKIPVRCVALGVGGFSYQDQHVTALNEVVLSKFPPSIEHIICWKCDSTSFLSCSTVRMPTGHVKTKEVCLCPGDFPRWFDLQIYLTKAFIRYIPDYIPNWDEDDPAWIVKREAELQPEHTAGIGQYIHSKDSENVSPPGAMGERPIGVQSIELMKYLWEDEFGGKRTCLVWKSFYD